MLRGEDFGETGVRFPFVRGRGFRIAEHFLVSSFGRRIVTLAGLYKPRNEPSVVDEELVGSAIRDIQGPAIELSSIIQMVRCDGYSRKNIQARAQSTLIVMILGKRQRFPRG